MVALSGLSERGRGVAAANRLFDYMRSSHAMRLPTCRRSLFTANYRPLFVNLSHQAESLFLPSPGVEMHVEAFAGADDFEQFGLADWERV